MEKILKVAGLVVTSFAPVYVLDPIMDEEVECNSTDDLDDEFLLEDDTERNQWSIQMRVNGTPGEIQERLVKLFNQVPERVLDDVSNWTVEGVLIVHQGDSIEFFQDYKKV